MSYSYRRNKKDRARERKAQAPKRNPFLDDDEMRKPLTREQRQRLVALDKERELAISAAERNARTFVLVEDTWRFHATLAHLKEQYAAQRELTASDAMSIFAAKAKRERRKGRGF